MFSPITSIRLLIPCSSTENRFYCYFTITAVWCYLHLCLPPPSKGRLSYVLLWHWLLLWLLFLGNWDLAKSQSHSVLHKARMCLHSYKHEDMIKTCFRARRENVPGFSTKCWNWLSPSLFSWFCADSDSSQYVRHICTTCSSCYFIMSTLHRALHLHTACSIFSLEELDRDADFHLQCSWCHCSSGWLASFCHEG